MAGKVFEALSALIRKHGVASEQGMVLSELTLDEDPNGEAIGFNLIGAEFILTSEDGLVSVEEADGDVLLYSVLAPMDASVLQYLAWRANFLKSFEL